MKKSNILLIILAGTITAWFVIFQYLCARAVVDISNGKPSGTAFRYQYKKTPLLIVKRSGITLGYFNDLEIIGKGKVSITIIRGENHAISVDTVHFGPVKWRFDKKRMVLQLEGNDKKKSQEVRITVPNLKRLSCYYLEDLYIDGLDQQKLEMITSDVRYLILRDNKFKSLFLTCHDNGREMNLSMDKSNVLDSLFLNIGGTGAADIGCTGLKYSVASLSDSIKLTADVGILKNLIRR
ncbi:MAG TPA: hypothetical protein PKN44_15630 [Bacteroidales bacterium]|nr:hypothetical protein [Bacteroidales bacterium]